MTIHGDLYYEGKEFETRLKEKKPGDLSENELRTALGMPVGPNANKVPPPWLIAMQRYGPPPSYPNLKIPGLNAPIPEGCAFGYHAGGWGKPPVDENGKPLYGDVFGTNSSNMDDIGEDPNIDRSLWGALESESEEESEEEEEEQEKEAPIVDESGLVTPAEGLVTPSGISSIPAGMETPETIELRKKKIESEMEGVSQCFEICCMTCVDIVIICKVELNYNNKMNSRTLKILNMLPVTLVGENEKAQEETLSTPDMCPGIDINSEVPQNTEYEPTTLVTETETQIHVNAANHLLSAKCSLMPLEAEQIGNIVFEINDEVVIPSENSNTYVQNYNLAVSDNFCENGDENLQDLSIVTGDDCVLLTNSTNDINLKDNNNTNCFQPDKTQRNDYVVDVDEPITSDDENIDPNFTGTISETTYSDTSYESNELPTNTSNTAADELTQLQDNPPDSKQNKGRKRIRNAAQWKCNIRKRARTSGEEYLSSRKTIVRARRLKSPCKTTCKLKCFEIFSHEDRESIIKHFWNDDIDYDRKRQFVASNVEQIPIQRVRSRSGAREGKRKVSHIYTLSTKNGAKKRKKLEDKSKLSKRKMKKLTRLSVAELKQLVQRPDVVEMHDVTARDPKLLVQLKAHRNTVQVPRHWCFKRKYLQGKRGIEKPPFNLPDFIKKTGIMEMRASLQDKDEAKTLKAKMRERARPKLGKIDIDYQKLHDAFFK
ncbi:unnamed protein product [Diabrotica balteata]|uniref:PSP proline-rich domain-containing protein n=1 Tax=Diabrotica balteata TaxID=107213 RepID=A0A9N9T5S7_DIABA|nr:unnamed protein product [Diabrotica balteata]